MKLSMIINYGKINCTYSLNAGKGQDFRTGFFHVQGGALNRGLFFADPPPSLLGAVSGKISEIR
jgi:hypothetical protein